MVATPAPLSRESVALAAAVGKYRSAQLRADRSCTYSRTLHERICFASLACSENGGWISHCASEQSLQCGDELAGFLRKLTSGGPDCQPSGWC
jgi:hypothetical protein